MFPWKRKKKKTKGKEGGPAAHWTICRRTGFGHQRNPYNQRVAKGGKQKGRRRGVGQSFFRSLFGNLFPC